MRSALERRTIFGLSPNVFFLGLVSLLTDISSEMTITILPLFLANVLGVKTSIIGLIEGVAESTATLLKIFSGWLSDRLGNRKALTALGYGLSTLSKPFLYFANTWGLVLAVRFTDRVGKGVRTAPRDALVADSTAPGMMGKSFGFHRAMDTAGAFLGQVLAAGIVFLLQQGALEMVRGTFQTLVLVAIIPAALAVLIVLLFVREPRRAPREAPAVPATTRSDPNPGQGGLVAAFKAFDLRFRLFLAIVVLFTLGNSSDAFLILRAQNLGLSVFQIFLMLAFFNLVYSSASIPAGILSDRFGRRGIIALGWGAYALIYLGFALAKSPWQVWLLFILYGLYYGAAEGVARALVADLVPSERRGTAYGLYNGAVGVTVLPASLIAGALWQMISPAAPFYFGAGLAFLAVVGLLRLR